MSSVLLPWVQEMPWKCQSILLSGLRGPDDAAPPAVKSVGRWLRSISQQNADPSKLYMYNTPGKLPGHYELCAELEYMTCHFVHHVADALRCVSIWHPDEDVKHQAWMYHYYIAEELFHFIPEGVPQFKERHTDKVERK